MTAPQTSVGRMSTRKQTQAKDLPGGARWWEEKAGKGGSSAQEGPSCARWVSVEGSCPSPVCTSPPAFSGDSGPHRYLRAPCHPQKAVVMT